MASAAYLTLILLPLQWIVVVEVGPIALRPYHVPAIALAVVYVLKSTVTGRVELDRATRQLLSACGAIIALVALAQILHRQPHLPMTSVLQLIGNALLGLSIARFSSGRNGQPHALLSKWGAPFSVALCLGLLFGPYIMAGGSIAAPLADALKGNTDHLVLGVFKNSFIASGVEVEDARSNIRHLVAMHLLASAVLLPWCHFRITGRLLRRNVVAIVVATSFAFLTLSRSTLLPVLAVGILLTVRLFRSHSSRHAKPLIVVPIGATVVILARPLFARFVESTASAEGRSTRFVAALDVKWGQLFFGGDVVIIDGIALEPHNFLLSLLLTGGLAGLAAAFWLSIIISRNAMWSNRRLTADGPVFPLMVVSFLSTASLSKILSSGDQTLPLVAWLGAFAAAGVISTLQELPIFETAPVEPHSTHGRIRSPNMVIDLWHPNRGPVVAATLPPGRKGQNG